MKRDIVNEIMRLLEEDGFEVIAEANCNIELNMDWYELFITWRK